jgi:hypothetical protein
MSNRVIVFSIGCNLIMGSYAANGSIPLIILKV